jgi:hypothetical protein
VLTEAPRTIFGDVDDPVEIHFHEAWDLFVTNSGTSPDQAGPAPIRGVTPDGIARRP